MKVRLQAFVQRKEEALNGSLAMLPVNPPA